MESGKFVLRIPPQLHKALKEEAHQRGISLNDVCLERLSLQNKSAESTNTREIIKDSQVFFGKDLEGFIVYKDKIYIFLNENKQITALLEWDYEEKVLEKYPFRKSIKFLNTPKMIHRISNEQVEILLFGDIIIDQTGVLSLTRDKIKKAFLLKQDLSLV